MSSPSKNILWLTVSRVVSLLLLFIAYRQLFKYLGPYNYGQFQFVLSYVTLFGVVIDFGLQQYIVKKMSEDRSRAKHYFHNFLAVEVLLVALVYAAMIGVALFNGYEPIVFKAILVAGFGTTITGLSYPFLAVVTAFYDLKKAAFINFLASAVNVTIIFVTIYVGGSIVMLTTQQGIVAILSFIIYYQFVQKYIGKPHVLKGMSELDFSLVKTMFAAALPFAILVGFSTLYNRIDVVLIKHMLGYTETGLYSAAYKFYDLVAFFPAVVSHALYPLFASLMVTRDLVQVRSILEKYLRFMMSLAIPMGVGGTILAKPIITLLTNSNEYAGAAPVLSILVWAPAILFVYIIVNSLVISQLTKWATAITGVNVLVNIVGNLILLPRIGIIAAAIMTVVSEFLQGLFYFYFVRKKITSFKFVSYLWKPIIASAVMGLSIWFIQYLHVLILVAIAVVVYAASLFVLRFFQKDDIAFIKGLLGRGV